MSEMAAQLHTPGELVVHATRAEMLTRVEPFLRARAAAHGHLLHLLTAPAAPAAKTATSRPFLAEWRLGAETATAPDADAVAAVAAWDGEGLILSACTVDPAAPAAAIARALVARDVAIPHLFGPRDFARATAAAYAAQRPCRTFLRVELCLYECRAVTVPETPAGPTAGVLRAVAPDAPAAEFDRLARWIQGFEHDTRPPEMRQPLAGCRQTALTRAQAGQLFVWEVAGQPVAMASRGQETPETALIHAVYTPPETRRQGHARALVAALTRATLARGKPACTLYTDTRSAEANALYPQVGYRPMGVEARWEFSTARGPAPAQ